MASTCTRLCAVRLGALVWVRAWCLHGSSTLASGGVAWRRQLRWGKTLATATPAGRNDDGSHWLKGRHGGGGPGELRRRLRWRVLRRPTREGEQHEDDGRVASGIARSRCNVDSPRNGKRRCELSSTGLWRGDDDLCGENGKVRGGYGVHTVARWAVSSSMERGGGAGSSYRRRWRVRTGRWFGPALLGHGFYTRRGAATGSATHDGQSRCDARS
jgi:hypothetical protein